MISIEYLLWLIQCSSTFLMSPTPIKQVKLHSATNVACPVHPNISSTVPTPNQSANLHPVSTAAHPVFLWHIWQCPCPQCSKERIHIAADYSPSAFQHLQHHSNTTPVHQFPSGSPIWPVQCSSSVLGCTG
jgi:hypothetical protein